MTAHYLKLLNENGYCVMPVLSDSHLNYESANVRCMILAICNHGLIDCECNMERIHLEAGMRMCYANVMQLRIIRRSDDLQMRLLLLNDHYSFDSSTEMPDDVMRVLFENPVDNVEDPRVSKIINLMLDVLELYSDITSDTKNDQVSISTVRNVLLMLGKHAIEKSDAAGLRQLYTMADTYFRRFINDVNENIKDEHEVIFYARRLHITPKYLSEICKQKTGRKAKEIISATLLRSLKADLLLSGKSMKDLACDYGFADQSSLGKFFRKMTGLSPLHYKRHETSLK